MSNQDHLVQPPGHFHPGDPIEVLGRYPTQWRRGDVVDQLDHLLLVRLQGFHRDVYISLQLDQIRRPQ